LRHHSVVLIASVDVRADSTIADQVGEPLMSFFRIWLRFSAPVCKLWGIDTSESYVKLYAVSIG
jgi:hypothetical protein